MCLSSSGWSLYWLIIAPRASAPLVPAATQASIASGAPFVVFSAEACLTLAMIFIRAPGFSATGADFTDVMSASMFAS